MILVFVFFFLIIKHDPCWGNAFMLYLIAQIICGITNDSIICIPVIVSGVCVWGLSYREETSIDLGVC